MMDRSKSPSPLIPGDRIVVHGTDSVVDAVKEVEHSKGSFRIEYHDAQNRIGQITVSSVDIAAKVRFARETRSVPEFRLEA